MNDVPPAAIRESLRDVQLTYVRRGFRARKQRGEATRVHGSWRIGPLSCRPNIDHQLLSPLDSPDGATTIEVRIDEPMTVLEVRPVVRTDASVPTTADTAYVDVVHSLTDFGRQSDRNPSCSHAPPLRDPVNGYVWGYLVHHSGAFAHGKSGSRCSSLSLLARLDIVRWQRDPELRPPPGLARYADGAAMVTDDAMRDREAEIGALPDGR